MSLRSQWALGVAAWFAVGGSHVLDSVRYHTDRGLEPGSIYAGSLRLLAAVTGTPVSSYQANLSENLASPWSATVARLTFPVQALALLIVTWKTWKDRGRDLLRWAAAAVVAFGVLGKVLSPQYLVWFLPFLAALGGPTGRRARRIFLGAAIASSIVYPWGYLAFIKGWT